MAWKQTKLLVYLIRCIFSFFQNLVVEPPTAYLWTLYFLAQHYDKQRKTELALKTIDKAIEHTPTLVELYMTKGRILKVPEHY
jgi:hypothetical protein